MVHIDNVHLLVEKLAQVLNIRLQQELLVNLLEASFGHTSVSFHVMVAWLSLQLSGEAIEVALKDVDVLEGGLLRANLRK